MAITVGASHTAEMIVDASAQASRYGSGEVEVFATPAMIALMEQAASACLRGFLEPGQVSVGTVVNVEHLAATPMGMRVCATAVITAVDGRKVDFSVEASDEAGLIGKGTHSRFIVDKAKFEAKCRQKKRA